MLETATIKTIAAFLNSPDGGTLLIGVADDGTIHGLAEDYASLHEDGKDDRDRFALHLGNIVTAAMGAAAATGIHAQLHTVDGQDLCRVHVLPSPFPVDAKVVVDKGGQLETRTAFYVRVGNGTQALPDDERTKYVTGRWPGGPLGG